MRSALSAPFVALLLSACNAQFDFGTRALDAQPPPDLDARTEINVDDDGGAAADVTIPDVSIPDAPPPEVHCGAALCSPGGCCSTDAGTACVDPLKSGDDDDDCKGLLIRCDDSNDCPPGKICCAETGNTTAAFRSTEAPSGSSRLVRVHCETEAHCRSLNYVILCDPNHPTPCAQCVLSSLALLPPGYHQCDDTP